MGLEVAQEAGVAPAVEVVVDVELERALDVELASAQEAEEKVVVTPRELHSLLLRLGFPRGNLLPKLAYDFHSRRGVFVELAASLLQRLPAERRHAVPAHSHGDRWGRLHSKRTESERGKLTFPTTPRALQSSSFRPVGPPDLQLVVEGHGAGVGASPVPFSTAAVKHGGHCHSRWA